MKLNNWNDFLITENMDKAKSYMKNNRLSTADDGFKLLRDLLQKNMGYMYKFTVFYYEDKVSIGDLTELLDFLNSGDANKLRSPLDSYNNYNDLIDEIDNIKLSKAVKSVFDELIPSQKEMVLKPSGEYDKKFATLAQEIAKIPNNDSFFKKISKAKDYYDIIDLMTDFITKHKSGSTYDSILNKLADLGDDVEIVYQDPEEEIIISKVKRYEASLNIGSTNWCIVNQMSSWESYIYEYNEINQQYFIWNFSLGISDPNYFCGITVSADGSIKSAHDFNDHGIKNDLPSHIEELSSYLQPIPVEEYPEYEEIKREEKDNQKRLQQLATAERLRHLQEENIERRNEGKWDDEGQWTEDEENLAARAIIEHLIDEEGLDLDDLKDEGQDIYDVLFHTSITEQSYKYKIFKFEYSGMEFWTADEDSTDEWAMERELDLLYEFENNLNELFKNDWILKNCIDEEAIKRDFGYSGGDIDEDEIDWSDYVDEDDIRDNWEDYDDIEADEDGDMDEDSFDAFIQKLKDQNEDDAREATAENYNSDLNDDPYQYLIDHGMESSISKYVDHDKLARKVIDMEGYGPIISSYDHNCPEYNIDGNTYYVWREN